MDYICPTCKTKYVSTNGEKPQGIKWSDGHECDPRRDTAVGARKARFAIKNKKQ